MQAIMVIKLSPSKFFFLFLELFKFSLDAWQISVLEANGRRREGNGGSMVDVAL